MYYWKITQLSFQIAGGGTSSGSKRAKQFLTIEFGIKPSGAIGNFLGTFTSGGGGLFLKCSNSTSS